MQTGRAGPQGIAALLGQMGEAEPVRSVGRQHRREIQEPEGPKDLKVPNAIQGHRAFILSDELEPGNDCCSRRLPGGLSGFELRLLGMSANLSVSLEAKDSI